MFRIPLIELTNSKLFFKITIVDSKAGPELTLDLVWRPNSPYAGVI